MFAKSLILLFSIKTAASALMEYGISIGRKNLYYAAVLFVKCNKGALLLFLCSWIINEK